MNDKPKVKRQRTPKKTPIDPATLGTPKEILAQLRELDREISASLDALEAMLKS